MARLAIPALALALAAPIPACSSPGKAPVTTESVPAPGPERRATVRIDPAPGGKQFQGVWLELEGGARWVIAYRARADLAATGRVRKDAPAT